MARARLLVVDDEAGMLRAIDRVLAPVYDVRTARLPSLALEIAGVTPIDVAILDVRMPEMDGFALMSRLTEMQPGLDVILMTGSTDEYDARLSRAIREKAFFFLTKPFDRDVLLTLIERCVDLRRLDAENRIYVAELESELAAARVFQESLLPERGAFGNRLSVALVWEPSAELGGDFCDYVLADSGPAVLIADVAGHGASAAMLTGMVKLAFRAASSRAYAPDAVLQRIASSSALFPTGKHLTALCVRIQPEAGTLEFVNAGHPSGLVVRSGGGLERLESSMPIIHPQLEFTSVAPRGVRFGAGDRMVLYTDGLVEARNGDDAEFGVERLERALLAASPGAPDGAALAASLRRALGAFVGGRPLDDDLTIAVVERMG